MKFVLKQKINSRSAVRSFRLTLNNRTHPLSHNFSVRNRRNQFCKPFRNRNSHISRCHSTRVRREWRQRNWRDTPFVWAMDRWMSWPPPPATRPSRPANGTRSVRLPCWPPSASDCPRSAWSRWWPSSPSSGSTKQKKARQNSDGEIGFWGQN